MTHITAVITTHNRAHLLPRALDSVFNQTRAADEILVIDDGSTDDTYRLIRNHYPGVRYFYQKQSGISAARNTAIRHATDSNSDWLAFLDDDDSWQPEKLATQLQALEQQPEYRLCHSEEIWIRNGKRVNAMNK
jgi:glycosyltransferase involved in cell wall biosynthesis